MFPGGGRRKVQAEGEFMKAPGPMDKVFAVFALDSPSFLYASSYAQNLRSALEKYPVAGCLMCIANDSCPWLRHCFQAA